METNINPRYALYKKLAEIRAKFRAASYSKSGFNDHGGYDYYELGDIIPVLEPILMEHNLVFVTSIEGQFGSSDAVGTLVDYETGAEIEFRFPVVAISEPSKFRMNEVQAVGAALTYYRRYLYYQLLDFSSKDEIDSGDHTIVQKPRPNALTVNTTPAPAPAPAPTTTPTTTPATEEQMKKLLNLCEELYTTSPEHADFVQEIAVKTKSFKQCDSAVADTLIANIQTIITTIQEAH